MRKKIDRQWRFFEADTNNAQIDVWHVTYIFFVEYKIHLIRSSTKNKDQKRCAAISCEDIEKQRASGGHSSINSLIKNILTKRPSIGCIQMIRLSCLRMLVLFDCNRSIVCCRSAKRFRARFSDFYRLVSFALPPFCYWRRSPPHTIISVSVCFSFYIFFSLVCVRFLLLFLRVSFLYIFFSCFFFCVSQYQSRKHFFSVLNEWRDVQSAHKHINPKTIYLKTATKQRKKIYLFRFLLLFVLGTVLLTSTQQNK